VEVICRRHHIPKTIASRASERLAADDANDFGSFFDAPQLDGVSQRNRFAHLGPTAHSTDVSYVIGDLYAVASDGAQFARRI